MNRVALIFLLLITTCYFSASVFSQTVDFAKAEIVFLSKNQQRAATILKEEVQSRTGIILPVRGKVNPKTKTVIIITTDQQLKPLPDPYRKALSSLDSTGPEGFKIVSLDSSVILISGHDDRGALYGMGYLLRKMELRKQRIDIPGSMMVSSSPAYPIRGHQLGYRPKTNAYDAWSVQQFDTYIRQLTLFGANSIEIMPPVTDDDLTSPHMKLPAIDMIREQSRICKSYGLDVWMWYPNMGSNYTSPDSIDIQLAECEKIFKTLPKLDAVFVPGGDPGDLEPDVLFAWLAKEAVVLQKYHPKAKIWVSPQVFRPTQKWFDAFYKEVNAGYPWFGGVVYGPWIKEPVHKVREQMNSNIPLRLYPDITHSIDCQYPVPHWDPAFAITLERECYNPRPVDEKRIHDLYAPYSQGSISYSEGINDDVNKFVWTGQDWDPNLPVIETLRDYARFFIGPDYTETVAQGISSLENNFRGPLALNAGVNRTLLQWQDMEKKATPDVRANFRFQMFMMRACYDAFIQRRLVHETELERQALDVLADAGNTGSKTAIENVKKILQQTNNHPVQAALRQRCISLADTLYENIGSQLTVKKHGAADGRGNFIDNIDLPLNNAAWIMSQCGQIAALKNEPAKLDAIAKLLNRTNPGPGGFYDDLGSESGWSRVVDVEKNLKDPGGLESPQTDFGVFLKGEEWVNVLPVGFEGKPVPLAWMDQATTLYNTPLSVKYDHLDPKSSYRVRVAYTGRFSSTIKLVADQDYPVHDFLKTGTQPVYEFDVPAQAVADGSVVFTFSCLENDRGTQVSEIWLVRKPD